MKKKIWVMMHLNLSKYSDSIGDTLVGQISSKIKTKNKEVEVGIYSVKEYWKYPGEFSLLLFIASKKEVSVEEIITCFDVKWEYSECPTYDAYDPQEKTRISESAVWSEHVMGGELLDKIVTWTHVYSWHPTMSLEEELEETDV